MAKPTIAILHYATLPTIGGVETTIAAHARLFSKHGYPVKIITGDGRASDASVTLQVVGDAGSRSPRVAEVNSELADATVSARFHRLADDLHRELEVAFDLARQTPYVIAHNALSLHKNLALTVALARLAEAKRIHLVAWCHDFAWADPQYAGELYTGFPWDLLKTPLSGVKYVVVSQARRQELLDLWGTPSSVTRIAVVPPGIDPVAFLGVSPTAAQWIARYGLLDANPLLLLPARLTRRKNIQVAIEIVAELRGQGSQAKLVITGPPGPHNPANAAYLRELRAQRESFGLVDDVIFLHELEIVDGATLRDLYLLADALIFPSEREGFGIPLLEAGLVRLPIFCSDLAVFRQVAGDAAHYFAPGARPRDAASQIAATLAQDAKYRLKKRVAKQYAWERIFTDLIEPLVSE